MMYQPVNIKRLHIIFLSLLYFNLTFLFLFRSINIKFKKIHLYYVMTDIYILKIYLVHKLSFKDPLKAFFIFFYKTVKKN